jgi:hypothetical protein
VKAPKVAGADDASSDDAVHHHQRRITPRFVSLM